MNGKFLAVGVGPGDPELLTLKAVKAIETADVIVAPKSGADINIALKITQAYIKSKPILEVDMPMTKDEALLNKCHDNAASEIAALLDSGKNIAFLTLGDPSIYSTVMYVHKRLKAMGYDTAIVSGIPSFCAVAAAINDSLCERDEMLHIIPATYKDIDSVLSLEGGKILMKSGKSIMEIKDRLMSSNSKIVECASMENERVYESLSELTERPSYFSIVVVPPNGRK